jgi:hypothetical protein
VADENEAPDASTPVRNPFWSKVVQSEAGAE